MIKYYVMFDSMDYKASGDKFGWRVVTASGNLIAVFNHEDAAVDFLEGLFS